MGGGEINVAYEGTFGDLSSAGDTVLFGMDDSFDFDSFGAADSMPATDFTTTNGNGIAQGPTVSPKDVFNNNTDSAPPSTSFTNLTTPRSAYLDTPDGSFETSPMYGSMGTDKVWTTLFPDEDASFGAMAPPMARTTSSSSANQIVVHPGGEGVPRKRSSLTNSPVTFSPVVKHSSVAGVSARRRDKPLPPIVVDENDAAALKRARNTAAARKSRAKKVMETEHFQSRVAELEAEVAHWKAIALGEKGMDD